ncbi:MAG: ATP-binding protein [Erysipelotrichaceae bacterium]|nr:ATP-binding protein [Erysipelotrichaceae bacterium]
MKQNLPIGISNYRVLKERNLYHVDKTLMIKDFLDNNGTMVTLITRPRRFGKTLNMSMMAEFFDIKKDSKDIFKDTHIMRTEYASYINQYPTIFLTFKDACDTKENVISYLKEQISKQYGYFAYELNHLEMDIFENNTYEIIKKELLDNTAALNKITNALSFLTNMLYKYYDKKVMLFIDEYDTPFIEAHVNNFYEEVHSELALLLSKALKDNPYLELSIITGIQRVDKESIFSKLNNPAICTMADDKYSQYFGFTKDETKQLLEFYGLELNDEVRNMYDGYHIGNSEVYNPWSILNYADNHKLKPYWVNTSANTMIVSAIKKADMTFNDGFESLIENGFLETNINMETSFYEQSETSTLWGLFINAGYLTITNENEFEEYRIEIPNQEVVKEFKLLVSSYLNVSDTFLSKLANSLLREQPQEFLKTYQNILLIPSYYDYESENSYHMLFLSLCLYLQSTHKPLSNREMGYGRTDIVLESKTPRYPSYVFEFKYSKDDKVSLDKLADEAYQQIIREKSDAALEGRVILIGFGHHLKKVAMKWIVRE